MARFLFLNHNIYGRGTFLRCFNLGTHLAAMGHKIILITVSPTLKYRTYYARERGIEIIQFPTAFGGRYQGGGWGLLDTFSRISHLALKRFDIVYAFGHRPNVALPAYMEKFFYRTSLISDWSDWWCNGGLLSPERSFPLQYDIERFFEKNIRYISDGVTTISTTLWKRARALGIPEGRRLYLPSGADVEHIRPLSKRAMRERHGVPRNAEVVGYITASFIDADMLLRCMARVLIRRDKCLLMFIGPGDEWLRAMVRELGIGDRVIWTGFQPYGRIAEFLACCDIMALPMSDNLTNRGRWPNRIGEHMAAGKATVACAVGDMKQLFDSEKIGLLSLPQEDDFVSKTLYLLDHPHLAEELGSHARIVAETTYSWKALAERFCIFLDEIM